MRKHLGSVAALALGAFLVAAPAANAAVTIGGTSETVPQQGGGAGQNNFITDMTNVLGGSIAFVTHGTLSLAWDVVLTFTEVAAESGFNNAFTDGTSTMSENGFFNTFPGGGDESFSAVFGAGAVTGLEFTSSSNGSVDAALGENGFGIFFNPNVSHPTTFFLAYDDNGAGEDDNHDDYIVRVDVSPVPLPAAGFLLLSVVGGAVALRRRKSA